MIYFYFYEGTTLSPVLKTYTKKPLYMVTKNLYLLPRGHHSGALPLAKTGHADGPKIPANDVTGIQSVDSASWIAVSAGSDSGDSNWKAWCGMQGSVR